MNYHELSYLNFVTCKILQSTNFDSKIPTFENMIENFLAILTIAIILLPVKR